MKINCCCYELKLILEEQVTTNKNANSDSEILIYDPVHNGFGYVIDKELPIIQYIGYCPFCGTRFSEPLVLEYEEALEEKLGKPICDIKEEDIPLEFKSDEWWRDRYSKNPKSFFQYHKVNRIEKNIDIMDGERVLKI
jgi:hypothetical protein